MTSGRTAAETAFFERYADMGWHSEDRCVGQNCVIHHPSDHHLREWPMTLRETALIERRCEHGIGHPDPDSWRAMNRLDYGDEDVNYGWQIHGCDKCCITPEGPSTSHDLW